MRRWYTYPEAIPQPHRLYNCLRCRVVARAAAAISLSFSASSLRELLSSSSRVERKRSVSLSLFTYLRLFFRRDERCFVTPKEDDVSCRVCFQRLAGRPIKGPLAVSGGNKSLRREFVYTLSTYTHHLQTISKHKALG